MVPGVRVGVRVAYLRAGRLCRPRWSRRRRWPRRRRLPRRRRSRRSRLFAFFRSPQSIATTPQVPWRVLVMSGAVCGAVCVRLALVLVMNQPEALFES